jgi:hypothetical protein
MTATIGNPWEASHHDHHRRYRHPSPPRSGRRWLDRPKAAIGLAALTTGATVTNLFLLPGMASAAVITVTLGVAFTFIARLRAGQTRTLIRQLK